MNDFDQFERRLGAALRSDADARVGGFEAGSIARAAIAGTQRRSRLSGRGRGMTLLAAAALLLVGGALAAGSDIFRVPSIVPPVPAPSLRVVATASPDATPPGPSYVASSEGAWIATGPMVTPRYGHTAVRLLDGRVLVAGGQGGQTSQGLRRESYLTSAELYDPDSGTWSATGNMLKPHAGIPATLLPDGRVLVGDVDDPAPDSGNRTFGAEVYDTDSGTWSSTGKVFSAGGWWAATTATVLRDGKVLVAGHDAAQLYDPESGTWSATGKVLTPRHDHTATLLPDGRVLVAGGTNGGDRMVYSAELYDPATGSWTAIANTRDGGPCRIGCPRGGGMATLLQDGTLLFMRGSSSMPIIEFAEIYDPVTGTWTPTGDLAWPDAVYFAATRLLDGTVLVAGGTSGPEGAVTAELYDPATRSWTKTADMLRSPRSGAASPAMLLVDGTVLVAGGFACQPDGAACTATGATELYIPAGVSPPPAVVALPPAPGPSPTQTSTSLPTPLPTPFPPQAGPVPVGARSWKVTVVNSTSAPGTLFLAEEGENGPAQLCGSVTPNVVTAGLTQTVTFLLPPKRITNCWLMVNPVPGGGGSLFQTSDAPMAGKIVIWMNEGGAVGAWASP